MVPWGLLGIIRINWMKFKIKCIIKCTVKFTVKITIKLSVKRFNNVLDVQTSY